MIRPELNEKILSGQLLVIVIIDFKRYPNTYCLIQGRCFICNQNVYNMKNVYLNIIIKSFNFCQYLTLLYINCWFFLCSVLAVFYQICLQEECYLTNN